MTVESQAQLELVQCLAAPLPRVALGHWWDRWMLHIAITRRSPVKGLVLSPTDVLQHERHYVAHELANAILSHEALQLKTVTPFDSPIAVDARTWSVNVLASTEKIIK